MDKLSERVARRFIAETVGAESSISRPAPTAAHEHEIPELEELLKKHGYNPADAKKLNEEGMGPSELEHILKTAPHGVGSLEYTHNFKKVR